LARRYLDRLVICNSLDLRGGEIAASQRQLPDFPTL
jgi:hypothetical protein